MDQICKKATFPPGHQCAIRVGSNADLVGSGDIVDGFSVAWR
jgi:hypothetical protein